MKKIASFLIVVLFSACGDYISVKPGKSGAENNNSQDLLKNDNQSLAQAKLAYKQEALSPLHKQKNMVHIIRKANGTTIDFWIDLYNDDVRIDYEFDNSLAPLEAAPINTTKVQKITSKKAPRSKPKNQVDILQHYLASYEKAQKLTYSKKYSKALVAINQALNLSKDIEQGWKLKGSILYKLGDKVGAKKAWKKALKINPYARDVKKSIASLKR